MRDDSLQRISFECTISRSFQMFLRLKGRLSTAGEGKISVFNFPNRETKKLIRLPGMTCGPSWEAYA